MIIVFIIFPVKYSTNNTNNRSATFPEVYQTCGNTYKISIFT